MDHHYFYHQHQQELQHQLLNPNPNPYLQVSATSVVQDQASDQKDRDKFPQWSYEETKEFLSLRFEFDDSFTETKRNKALWEAISARLQLKGFCRTPDQCKSKWKNLVTRFKGCESMELEANKQFPFHEEMKIIFSKRMEERLIAIEKEKGKGVQVDESEEEDEDVDYQDEKKVMASAKKRKMEKDNKGLSEVHRALRDFMKQQLEMEAKWMEASEAREIERKLKEQEWRRTMEALQRERMELESQWREMEASRQAREDARAERRHALLVAILNKLEEKGL